MQYETIHIADIGNLLLLQPYQNQIMAIKNGINGHNDAQKYEIKINGALTYSINGIEYTTMVDSNYLIHLSTDILNSINNQQFTTKITDIYDLTMLRPYLTDVNGKMLVGEFLCSLTDRLLEFTKIII